MRRRLLLAGTVTAFTLGVGWLFLWIAAPKDGINRENFERIQAGMTREEVYRILGGPPEDYAKGGIRAEPPDGYQEYDWLMHIIHPPYERGVRKGWFGETGIVWVWLLCCSPTSSGPLSSSRNWAAAERLC